MASAAIHDILAEGPMIPVVTVDDPGAGVDLAAERAKMLADLEKEKERLKLKPEHLSLQRGGWRQRRKGRK